MGTLRKHTGETWTTDGEPSLDKRLGPCRACHRPALLLTFSAGGLVGVECGACRLRIEAEPATGEPGEIGNKVQAAVIWAWAGIRTHSKNNLVPLMRDIPIEGVEGGVVRATARHLREAEEELAQIEKRIQERLRRWRAESPHGDVEEHF